MGRRQVALAAVAIGLAGCGGSDDRERSASRPSATPTPAPGRVFAADDRSFERVVVESDQPVLVLFWAPWSGPDRVVMPYLESASRERPGLRVVKVDVDKAPRIARLYEVLAIPMAMVLRRGRPVGERVTGALPRKRWEAELDLDKIAPAEGR